jgi:DNA-directed RNA polymerase specialized sigma subunit
VQKRTRSILTELDELLVHKDKANLIETRASNIINGAINLINHIRVQNIYNPENFDRSLRDVARFLKEHSDQYKALPTREQIQATTGVEGQGDSNGASRNVNNVLNNIKSKSTVTEDAPKINAEVNSSKLKSMLAGLKKEE